MWNVEKSILKDTQHTTIDGISDGMKYGTRKDYLGGRIYVWVGMMKDFCIYSICFYII